jgi:hypothetical protein
MTALGAAAIQDGGASLGLHAGEKAVGLGAVAAVGLKGTLRHGTELLRQKLRFLLKTFGLMQQFLSIPDGTGFSQGEEGGSGERRIHGSLHCGVR